MILPLAVDPQALLDRPGKTATERGAHRSFLREMRQLAIVVIEDDHLRNSELLAAINRLPQAVRKLWKEALLDTHRWRRSRRNWPGFSAGLEALSQLDRDAALVVLGESLSKAAGLREEETRILPETALEIARFSLALESKAVERMRELRGSDLERNQTPEAIWRERFQSLAEVSQHVVVVDRFAAPRQANASRSQRQGGLGTFLRFLERIPSVREVKVYTSNGTDKDDCSLDEASDAVLSAARGSRFLKNGTLKAFLLEGRDFGELYHDRYVRFDRTRVDIGTGLEVFEGRLRRQVSCRATVLDGRNLRLVKDLEARLKEAARLVAARDAGCSRGAEE